MDGEEIEQTAGSRCSANRQQTETEKEVKEMAKPLLHIHCITEKYCDYPVAVKVAMDDGSVQTYVLENRTQLMFNNVMDSLKKMEVGYQYQPKHSKKKNRIHRCER